MAERQGEGPSGEPPDETVPQEQPELRKDLQSEASKDLTLGFPGGAVVENLPANAGDTGWSPGLGRSHMPWSGWAREP